MDLRRLRIGELVAGASGAVLAASLFLPWYEQTRVNPSARAPAEETSTAFTAWEAFAVIDVLLAIGAILGVGLLVVTATQRTASIPIAADALLTIVGSMLALVAVARVLNLPSDVDSGSSIVDAGREPAAWLGLLAAIGVPLGATLAMRDERLSDPARPTDATGVPIAARPEVERLPAPPRA